MTRDDFYPVGSGSRCYVLLLIPPERPTYRERVSPRLCARPRDTTPPLGRRRFRPFCARTACECPSSMWPATRRSCRRTARSSPRSTSKSTLSTARLKCCSPSIPPQRFIAASLVWEKSSARECWASSAMIVTDSRALEPARTTPEIVPITRPGARAYYDRIRGRGKGHNAALRQLSNRLVGILHGCLASGTHYDEAKAWHHGASG